MTTLTDRYEAGVEKAGVRAEPLRFRYVPREVLEDGGVYPAHIVLEPRDLIVCYLETTYAAEQALKEPDGLFGRETEHSMAMRSLLLAAPDLLGALKAICSEFAQTHPLIVAGRAAIAKATTPEPSHD